jgi:hypothetical protein
MDHTPDQGWLRGMVKKAFKNIVNVSLPYFLATVG